MLKRKIDRFLRDFFKTSRNALLISGARQIGKTFSIREYGKEYKHFVEINFVDNPEAAEMFGKGLSAHDILLRLSLLTKAELVKGETLIFFDEVQECPEIVTAIKFLVEEGSYRYVLSGSLLGVDLKDLRSVPVGYMSVKNMYPLDFEEFIRNVGVGDSVVESVGKAWLDRTSVDSFVHAKMMELYRLYLVVGGMPDAVRQYLETNNLQTVIRIQRDIINLYKRDISKYDSGNKLYIEEIFNLIPPELNAKNKRFVLKNLNKNAKFSRLQNSFLWLTDAGVALPVYNVEEPKVPLLLSRSRNLFKLFQSDVGLLAAQYAEGIQLRIIEGGSDINYGSVYENAVAQELTAHGFNTYYYNNKKRGELDFVVEMQGGVLPIEVKSGKDYAQHRALNNVLACADYDIPYALVLNNDNLRVDGRVVYAPVYMTMFLEHDNDAPEFYKIDLTGLG